MAIIDLIKWNGSPNTLAYKFPSEELATWSQLIVNETQEAFLVHEGIYEGPFKAGRHTLSTENLPIIRDLIGIPFGGQSPFSAEVWYVNLTTNLNVKWGTDEPILLQDPKFNLMVPVRAYGQYGIKVVEPKRFLLKLVGTLNQFDSDALSTYFRGIFLSKIKSHISNQIIDQRKSVLEISPKLEEISKAIKAYLQPDMSNYGISLEEFSVISINFPETDSAIQRVKAALAKKAEMQILGFDYQTERSFDVLQAAASNEGTAGGLIGAGIGMGLGTSIGTPMGASMISIGAKLNPDPATAKSTGNEQQEKIRILRELAEMKESGILTEEEFIKEKQRILKD